MPVSKTSFLDKVLGRIDRLHADGLQTVVQRLARERSFLETLFHTIEDGILVVDKSGRIAFFNQAVTRLLGLESGKAESQPITRYLPGLDWEKLAALGAEGGHGVIRHEFEVSYPRPRFLRLYAAPLDGEAARNSGLVLILHDATEARQKTFEVIESERLQALTLLAASVAHEVGNPLNALNIHLQLMERELKKLRELTPEAGRRTPVSLMRSRVPSLAIGEERSEIGRRLETYLAVARGEIGRLDYIVTQFLQAIRPAPAQKQTVSLNDVVRATLDLLRPELENRGLTVKEKLERSLPLALLDPAQMKQVLVNLAKNAMQAMTKGGTLTLETGQGSEGVWVSLEDTGGGIPQEKMNRIFEPFYTTKEKGTGLGLMIVQRIVGAHGGRVTVRSSLGQGTAFRIWLPLHPPQPRLLEAHLHD
ncbi:MAG: two-component system sensor histidine kinase NtrB [Limisphaerales bacterium]